MSSTIQSLNLSEQQSQLDCYHCGEEVNDLNIVYSTINDVEQKFCCLGCSAVAETIMELGFGDYYIKRTEKGVRPDSIVPEEINGSEIYNQLNIQKLACDEVDENSLETELIIRGITCPACSWLCENRLSSLEGIQRIDVNYSNHRAKVRWNKQKINLSNIMQAIRDIGYEAKLYNKHSETQHREEERKHQLQSLGLTAVLGMQVMMISIALYFGKNTSMDITFINLFHWVNLVLTTPILFISGKTFFKNALRDLKISTVSMDLAVSLGLALAYIASVYATVIGQGEIYFDTIVMFIFFLSASRYIEFMLRQKSLYQTQSSELALPIVARQIIFDSETSHEKMISAVDLQKGDIILIKPGETIPADGALLEGVSHVNEAMLTGEQKPIFKQKNAKVIAGSINIDSPIKISVKSSGDETVLASINKLIEHAQYEKPTLTRFSDKIAGYFISAVIIIAVSTILISGINNVEIWLDRVIAVLIVSCPCALSLAMPSVYSAAIGRLSREGIIFKNIDRLLVIPNIKHFIFDKTGTCTQGKFKVASIKTYAGLDKNYCLAVTSAIEKYSEHPIASAFQDYDTQNINISKIHNYPGEGLSAKLKNNKEIVYLGNIEFIKKYCSFDIVSTNQNSNYHSTYIYLAAENYLLASIELADLPRDNIELLINYLTNKGAKKYLCSGDNLKPTQYLSDKLGFDEFYARMLPKDKLMFIEGLQNENKRVAMIGDGINDAPTLSRSDVSFAISEGSDLAQLEADAVILNKDMLSLVKCIEIAQSCKKIIKQNIIWALSYNIIALPIAVNGMLAPWMAAIGMSLSSLLVILNADRIRRLKLQ